MSYKEKQEAELAAKEGPKVHMSCRGHGFPWSTGNFIWQWTILIQRWISSE
jgi:primase-polymerase (primpol)-like protein